jgi:hypothetical protein
MKTFYKTTLHLALLIGSWGFASITPAQVLELYGGQNHDVYLGCLNCNKYQSNSIWNAYGRYGSKYQTTSIWNEYGLYGGEYSRYSPFNAYTQTPPVVVDRAGNFYGYLTVNAYKQKRATFALAEVLYRFWKLIPNDVSKWYDEIFK